MDIVVTGIAVAAPRLREPGDTLADSPQPPADFDPAALLGPRGLRYKDRATLLGMLCAKRALDAASLLDSAGKLSVPGTAVGVVASSNVGNLDTVCATVDRIATATVVGTRPMDLPNASSNIIASSVAVRFGLRGPNLMVCNGDSSGLDAIWLACGLIRADRAEQVIVIGTEPVNDYVARLAGVQPDRLFDGAAAVVVEKLDTARARGADPVARLDRYARRARAEGSVLRVLGGFGRPAMWLAPTALTAQLPMPGVPRRDLVTTLGQASGALGVLQVVAATAWFSRGEPGHVLASAGTAEDGVASLLIGAGVRR